MSTPYRVDSSTFAGPARLLPAFDEYLLGWKDRRFAVPDGLAKRVRPGGGIVRAVAVDDGVVVGTWSLRGGRVAIDGPAERFADEAADVERFASEAQETLRP